MFCGGKKLHYSILRSRNQWKETSLPKRVLTQSTFLANTLLCTHSTQVLEQLFRFLIWPFSSALSCIITNVFLEKQRKGIELFHSSSSVFFREMSTGSYHWECQRRSTSIWNHFLKTEIISARESCFDGGRQGKILQLPTLTARIKQSYFNQNIFL